MTEGNCGKTVWRKEMVLVALGREGDDDYDHEANMRREAARQKASREKRGYKDSREKRFASDAALALSMSEETMGATPHPSE